jgi:hypothetical protein
MQRTGSLEAEELHTTVGNCIITRGNIELVVLLLLVVAWLFLFVKGVESVESDGSSFLSPTFAEINKQKE